MRSNILYALPTAVALAPLLMSPTTAGAQIVKNPSTAPDCMNNTAFFSPTLPPSIGLPRGFTASVFASGLNMPTGIAFLGNPVQFKVYVLESGHGLPSVCNDNSAWPGGQFAANNPFTPDILVFDQKGNKIPGSLGKPTAPGVGFQPSGPAVDIAFELGLAGGRLFATNSNQATHASGQNNSSRIVVVNRTSGQVMPFITQLPTGDHPTEQLAFNGGWIYWSQGSTTNSGVVGLDNGGGANQSDIPCQAITLSGNTFSSGGGVMTSGYSPFGVTHPAGTVIPAFFNSFTGKIRQGVCDGAILRAPLFNPSNIQAFSWGYRNGYAIRFPPPGHPLFGGLLVGEDGADERGARPSNNAPELAAAGPPECQRHPGLSRLARPVRLSADEPGGV